MAQPEPKYEPIPETEPEVNPGILFPNAEPRIDIVSAGEEWRVMFKFHWVFFSLCFALLVLYNSYQLYKTYRLKHIANRSYVSIVQTLVVLLGLTRALALSISPYELTINTPGPVPFVIPRLLFAFGFPCLFSGYTFVHKIFLNVSKVRIMGKNALGSGLVTIVLVVHFIAVLSSEIITSYVLGVEFLLVICAIYYFTGCLGIAISLLFSGRRVVQRTRKIHSQLSPFKFKHTGMDIASEKTKEKTVQVTSKVIRITALAVIFGFLGSLFYIYTLVWMIRATLGDSSSPRPWIWLMVNSLLRLFELFLAATMSYAVGSSYQRNSHTRIFVSRCEETVNTAF